MAGAFLLCPGRRGAPLLSASLEDRRRRGMGGKGVRGKGPGEGCSAARLPGKGHDDPLCGCRRGERFFWQRLNVHRRRGEAVRLTPQPGRAASSRPRGGRNGSFGSTCTTRQRRGEAVRLTPQPGRAASSRLRAGGTLLLAASKCTSAARAGCPLNVAARVGHLLAAASGGTALLTTSARYAGGAGQLRLTDRAA